MTSQFIPAMEIQPHRDPAGSTSWQVVSPDKPIPTRQIKSEFEYVGSLDSFNEFNAVIKHFDTGRYFAVTAQNWINHKFEDGMKAGEVHPRFGTLVTDEFKGDRAMVPEFNISKLERQIAKLNRRAVKLGVPSLKLNIDRSAPVIRYLDPELGQYGPIRRYYFVTVDGIAPRLDGFQLVAKLEGTEHGNMIKTLIETDLPEEFRMRITCDHCKTDRYRKDTFILRDQSGALKQVGRNCLADYLRSADQADWYVRLAELRDYIIAAGEDDPDGPIPGHHVEHEYDLLRTLELTASAVRQHGWTSSKSARESDQGFGPSKTATAEYVKAHYAKQKDKSGKLINQLEVIEDDKELAELTLTWLKQETSKPKLSDYLHNCRMLVLANAATYNQISILASTLASYCKHAERELEYARRHTFGTANEYLGAVGSKLNITARLVKVFNYEVDGYGYRASSKLMAIYIFRTVDGHTVTWRTEDRGLPKDIEYKVTGTVKAHEDYKGTCQTVLTRCKLESDDKSVAPDLAFSPARKAVVCDIAASHHVSSPLGKSGNMDRAKWIKLYSELVKMHGKPSINLKDCVHHVVFSWR